MLEEEIYVGQMVRFREWDDMAAEYGFSGSGNIDVPFQFTREMRGLCGKEATVVKIERSTRAGWPLIRLSPSPCWSISAGMLEPICDDNIQESDQEIESLFR